MKKIIAGVCVAAAVIFIVTHVHETLLATIPDPIGEPRPENNTFKNLTARSSRYLKRLMDQYAQLEQYDEAMEVKKILDQRNISLSD